MNDIYNPAFYDRDIVEDRPTLGETVRATVGYRLNPLLDNISQTVRYGTRRQEGYDPWSDLGDYTQFASDLVRAVNPEHMADMKASIDQSIQRRETLADATLGNSLVAGLFDPVNLVALPLGGPVTSIARAALKSSVSVAAVEAGYEALIMQNLDPVQTIEESAMNVASAALFGGAIGGVTSIPRVRAAQAFERTREATQQNLGVIRRIENLAGMTREDIANAAPRAERQHAKLNDQQLSSRVSQLEAEARGLESRAANDSAGAEMNARAQELREEAKTFRNELGLRALENDGVDLVDPYRIMPTWFTESVLYKAVSTPMKRALQSQYPSAVKEAFVRSFGDSGIALAMNAIGAPSPQSVYQRAAVANGRWVAAHDALVKLWGRDIQTSVTSRLDFNVTNAVKTLSRSDETLEKWLTNLNEKRIKGDQNLSELEIEGIGIINKYFDDAQVRLEDVGLIGTRRGVERKIENLESELASLRSREARMKSKGKTPKEIIERVSSRIDMLEKNLHNERLTLNAFSEDTINPEAFLPRFWKASAIRNNRQEFEQILFDWYTNNPTTYVLNKKTGHWEVKELSTESDAVKFRVNLTIDRILGESDPTNVDVVSFGYGRSKHFRHREVDIPNSLVTKFIETNPISVMKTYAARIEPRYEYAKAFGKDIDGVILDLEAEMADAGASMDEINTMRRDYLHMYDRIAGVVRRDPSALNQQIANVLREASTVSYLGSAGLAALPDFGRIVMEYDMNDIIRGVQLLMDRNMVNMTVDEIRLAGEAIDILKGTAHLRFTEDMANNVDANELWTKARNAFFLLNGLAPITTLAKQLAGVVDAHTIIDYSIRLTKGQLDKQSTTWLARHGIGIEKARQIASQPFQKSDNGLYLPDSENWLSDNNIRSIAESRLDYTPLKMRFTEMTDDELTAHFSQEFEGVQIFTDEKIVGDYFATLRERGWGNLLGFMTDMRDIPDGGFSIHLDKKAIAAKFERIKNDPRSSEQIIEDARTRYENGEIPEDWYYHIKNETEAADRFQDVDDYFEFILAHELHHSRINRRSGESMASWENRIDLEALNYIENQKAAGRELALEKEIELVAREQEEVVLTFRSALNSGVLNTIMSGTPADKPIITDGVVYIPMRVAQKFGMEEDARFRGYARIENGLLGLPFQFYSYALANVNKTVGALATGQAKNRAVGITTMMGLAYLSLKLRTPDFVWEDMTVQDKFARSFDMSGVMALYSDLFYTAMHTSLALGGPNITGGLLAPKFPQEPSALDAISGVAGAGPSWAVDNIRGVWDFANGDYAEGGKTIARNMPFARMWFWKDEVNQITNAWAN